MTTTETEQTPLHTCEQIVTSGVRATSITRITVPGGWIYDFGNRAVFVPEPFVFAEAIDYFEPRTVDL